MDFPFRDEDFCVFGRKICHQIGHWLVCYDPDVLLSSKSIHTLQAGNFHNFYTFTLIYSHLRPLNLLKLLNIFHQFQLLSSAFSGHTISSLDKKKMINRHFSFFLKKN